MFDSIIGIVAQAVAEKTKIDANADAVQVKYHSTREFHVWHDISNEEICRKLVPPHAWNNGRKQWHSKLCRVKVRLPCNWYLLN